MQGKSSAFAPFTETVDLNQESLSNSNMDHPSGWNNVLHPVEGRRPHNGRSFSGWDLGESSSSANLQDLVPGDGLKVEHGRSTRFEEHRFEGPNVFLHERFDTGPGSNHAALTETILEEHRSEQSNMFIRDIVGNGPNSNNFSWGASYMPNSGSDRYPVNVNLNARYVGNNDDSAQSIGGGAFSSFYKPGRTDPEQIPSASMSTANVGTSSGNSGYFFENDDESGSSLGSWGSSCKRKALEGTSAQPYPGGNASFFPQADNFVPQITHARHNASSSLSICSPNLNSPGVIPSQQMNPRFGVGMRGVASDVFPPSSVTGTAENSTRNFGARVNIGHQESSPFNLPSSGNAIRHSSARSSNQSSGSTSFSESSEFRLNSSLPNSSNGHSNQPHLMHGPGPGPGPSLTRNMPPTWNVARHSRTGSSSSSLMAPREMEAGFRSSVRNNEEHPMFATATETRNLVQDPTDWSLATGSSRSHGGAASSSRAGPSSSSRTFPTTWLPHQNSSTQSQLRLPEFAPWTLFPAGESEAGSSRGHYSPFSSGPSSSSSPEERGMTSGANGQGHHRPYPRSAYLMEVPGDDTGGWRSLAADIDGRQRLVSEIRHVLNAMRRGENLRAEDYMLFDPFINGVAEMHDRHRDMRLDVDNMSYEELLALEERIGDVNTGLNEETILQSMKQRKYLPFLIGSPSKLEPCCICQEEYVIGETIGTLDCGHDFHTDCVKQWLVQKNLCPICKMTGLGT